MTGLSLFSGIGGLDLAFENAGGQVIAMCEIDPFCRSVLCKHWPDVPIFEDVRALRGEDIGAVDIIYGGFPCQPFSSAGKRKAFKDNRDLWPEYFRLVREIRPTWVIGENVDGFISLGLDRTLHDLESENYSARAFSIPAGAVGAPHKRYRTFVVAHADSDGLQGDEHESGDGQERIQGWEKEYTTEFFTYFERLPGRDNLPSPRICRASDGIPNRTHRLKALGNAVVPAQAFPIFKAIMELTANG